MSTGSAHDPSFRSVAPWYPLALTSIALFGIFLLWRSTPFGLGLVNDSSSYINGAANLLAGNGYMRTSGGGELKPITHFPPFFSLLLGGLHLIGLDFFQAAHGVVLVCFGIAILLCGSLVYMLTRSRLLALCGAFLLACSDTTLGVYAYALSEPLFIVFILAAMYSFARYYEQQRLWWMALCGGLLGMACLTRFSGISLLFTLPLAVYLLSQSWKTWLRPVMVMLGAALPAVGAWSLYNLLASGEVGNRLLVLHLIPIEKLYSALKNLLTWLAPQDLLHLHPIFGWALSALSLAVLPLLCGVVIWVWTDVRKTHPTNPAPPPGGMRVDERAVSTALAASLALHTLVYFSFLVASISLFDAATPLDDRILLVLYIPELILFMGFLGLVGKATPRFLESGGIRLERWLLAAVLAALVIFNLRDGLAVVSYLSRDGLGFNHSGWRNSPAIAQVNTLDVPILYSNRPTAIYLLTGKSAYVTPTPTDAVTMQERSNYATDIAEMQRRVLDGEAALVLFELQEFKEEGSVYQNLIAGLPLYADYGTAQIFAMNP